MADVRRQMEQHAKRVEKAMVFNMQYLGEQCVNVARSVPAQFGFHDQTGNLRSSIGYIVFNDGRPVHQNFKTVLKGSKGVTEGKKIAAEIGSGYPGKIVLVVVAGMNYAVEVESRGRDVLTSAEIFAQQRLPDLIKKFKTFSA